MIYLFGITGWIILDGVSSANITLAGEAGLNYCWCLAEGSGKIRSKSLSFGDSGEAIF